MDSPKASASGAVTLRAKTSVEPPAGKDTIATMGFLGQSDSLVARADPHKLAKAQILNMSDLVQVISVSKGFLSSMSNIVLEIQ
jgi:hypothetical protein